MPGPTGRFTGPGGGLLDELDHVLLHGRGHPQQDVGRAMVSIHPAGLGGNHRTRDKQKARKSNMLNGGALLYTDRM
jgi:hypothetical protein